MSYPETCHCEHAENSRGSCEFPSRPRAGMATGTRNGCWYLPDSCRGVLGEHAPLVYSKSNRANSLSQRESYMQLSLVCPPSNKAGITESHRSLAVTYFGIRLTKQTRFLSPLETQALYQEPGKYRLCSSPAFTGHVHSRVCTST